MDIEKIIQELCSASRRDFADPHLEVEWPEAVGPEEWCMSPELMSAWGTPLWDSLDEPRQKRLSFFEAVNFFSLNIQGEKPLVEGLARRLYRRGGAGANDYLHHFLDEENKHMQWFAGFCRRYAGKIYPDKKMSLPRTWAEGEEDVCFFAKVMIFEEIVDAYNQRMAKDTRLAGVARRINYLHHRDEARHLAFGRIQLRRLFKANAPSWPAGTQEGVQRYLDAYMASVWREYVNPEMYSDAGLEGDPFEISEALEKDAGWQERQRDLTRGCVNFLRAEGLLAGGPAC